MFSLAEQLRSDDPKLAQRMIEEARWGLDWILKTSFGDGFRVDFATMDRWTDGVLGTQDDMILGCQQREAMPWDVPLSGQEVQLEVGKPQTITWIAETISAGEPWVVVVVPNGDLSAREELVGGFP